MKSRLYYAISCFLLAVVLLFLAVPLFTHRLYPKQQAIRVLHTMEKGEQLTDKDIEPITVGALQLSEGIALTEEDVIGRYAAVDLVAEDILFLSKLSQLPLEGDLPKDILLEENTAQLMTLRMIEGSEYPIPETGDVIKINLFDKKWKDIPELQFVLNSVCCAAEKSGRYRSSNSSIERKTAAVCKTAEENSILCIGYCAEQ